MFEFIQHKALYQIDVDVRTLPLEGHVVVAVGKNPAEWKDENIVGAWDYWRETRGIDVEEADKLWVQVQEWDGSTVVFSSAVDGKAMHLRNIGRS